MADFKLNPAGGAEVLKSDEAAKLVADVAHKIADDIGEQAWVDEHVTDRAVAMITVPAYMQASDGALTKAAAKLGLEVHPK